MFATMLTPAEIQKMTIPERMDAIDLLWESIIESGTDVPSPAWHQDVLRERMREIESGKAEFMTLEELRRALRIPPQ